MRDFDLHCLAISFALSAAIAFWLLLAATRPLPSFNELDVLDTRNPEIKVMIAIPMCERQEYTHFTASVLMSQDGVTSNDIYVFRDNCKLNPASRQIRNWYGPNVTIIDSPVKLNADKNTRRSVEEFVRTKYDYVLILDTDLILAANWRIELARQLKFTQGIVTLYNSNQHTTVKCGEMLCVKKDIGSAGVVMSQARALQSLQTTDDLFDWGFCGIFQKNNIPIYAFRHSVAFHIGSTGQNTNSKNLEEAVKFSEKVQRWVMYTAKAFLHQRLESV